ncbi:hypothetical protein [Geomicrobium sediminis]|uniref:Bacterial toxin 44 domain-containing protein n=1 Tax=Geomicrobium sediminis TaxID=1347788 RepID=A0ABS2P702_9BACL|nr:hypothetical protein [Geomicrobium sediminis]MBM7631079.1 hypothetical protein [Geomicrobium sediminis]
MQAGDGFTTFANPRVWGSTTVQKGTSYKGWAKTNANTNLDQIRAVAKLYYRGGKIAQGTDTRRNHNYAGAMFDKANVGLTRDHYAAGEHIGRKSGYKDLTFNTRKSY